MPPSLAGSRVLLVGDWPPPLGGVAVHMRSLRDALRRAGAKATVIDVGRGQHASADVVASGGVAAFAVRLGRLTSEHGIVHLHTSGANPKSWALCAVVGLAARAFGARALVTLHSGSLAGFLTTPSRAVAARIALASYERVVCVSDEISRILRRLGAAQDRHLVAPAFGLEGLQPAALPEAVRVFRGDHAPLIAGMIAPGRHYGLPELLSAFDLVRGRRPGAGLVLFGLGSEEARPDDRDVLGLGPIDRGAALAVMRDANVFVRPTLVDGDSMSVREALALGTPVVATAVGKRPAEVTTCAPGDVEGLARALDDALARGRPPSFAPPEDGIDSVLSLYAGLLARPRSTSRPLAT